MLGDEDKNKLDAKKYIVLAVLCFGAIGVYTQDWIGAYSSNLLEEEKQEPIATYTMHSLRSRRETLEPKLIRLVDETYESSKFGVLFTYQDLEAETVEICAEEISWKCIVLEKNQFGIHFGILEESKIASSSFQYKYRVDGFYEEEKERTFFVESKSIPKTITVKVLDSIPGEVHQTRTVEFSIYSPEAETISLAGNFNAYSPDDDPMTKKANGVFTVQKRLLPGKYDYYFYIDGEKTKDLYNSEVGVRTDTDEEISIMTVDKHERIPEIIR